MRPARLERFKAVKPQTVSQHGGGELATTLPQNFFCGPIANSSSCARVARLSFRHIGIIAIQ